MVKNHPIGKGKFRVTNGSHPLITYGRKSSNRIGGKHRVINSGHPLITYMTSLWGFIALKEKVG